MYICAPILETSSINAAGNLADAIELRLDYLNNFDLASMIRDAGKPVIVTYRPREQGGQLDLSLDDRRKFWLSLEPEIIESITYADFELDLVKSFGDTSPIPWNKVICSWHNFEETPDNLTEIFEHMSQTPAGVIKIATNAKTISDCLKLYVLTKISTKPFIVLGMGMPGLMTRILANAWGGQVTFGALKKGAESASGQPSIDELKNLYRANDITNDTMVLGIMGNPVSHSLSPQLHNNALKSLNINGVYIPFQVEDTSSFIRDFVRPSTRRIDWNLRGLSVTIPHKLAVMPLLDKIDETAQRIGAVNTIVVEGNELHGYNTDIIGAITPLIKMMDIKGAKIAVIGAGGAARAVCSGLMKQGADVTIYARDIKKAEKLAYEFNMDWSEIDTYCLDSNCCRPNDIVINCTPIGMHDHSEGQSPVETDFLYKVKLVYDLIYTPEQTQLLKDAEAAGCKTLGGMAMLKAQAEAQFKLWTNVDTHF